HTVDLPEETLARSARASTENGAPMFDMMLAKRDRASPTAAWSDRVLRDGATAPSRTSGRRAGSRACAGTRAAIGKRDGSSQDSRAPPRRPRDPTAAEFPHDDSYRSRALPARVAQRQARRRSREAQALGFRERQAERVPGVHAQRPDRSQALGSG